MMKTKNISILLVLALFALIFAAAGCGKDKSPQQDTSQTGDPNLQPVKENPADKKVIIKINRKAITNKVLKEYVKHRYGDVSMLEGNAVIASRIFDRFREHCMLIYIVEQENIPVTQKEIDDYLKSKHLSLNESTNQSVLENVKIQKYLYNKLYNDIDVTDAEIREDYQKNINEYKRKQEVELHQILVKGKDRAYEIRRTLIKSPQNFAQIARADSTGREKKNGGRMGFFEKGTLPKDMEDVVFALTPNTISPVVESPYGFHIFKVTQVKSPRTLQPNTVKDDIKEKLVADKMRWAYEDFMAQLQRQLSVALLHQNLEFTYQSLNAGGPPQGENNNAVN